jgi:putative tricarboxylic transport membrane protein
MKTKRSLFSLIALSLVVVFGLFLLGGCGGEEEAAAPPPAAEEGEFPSRTIEIINQFGPGGGTDIFVRTLGTAATDILRVPVISVNITGGGGVAATEEFLRRPADGYNIRAIGPEQVINQLMGREDLSQMVPLMRCQYDQSILSVKKGGKFNTIQDVVEYAKANPGALTVAGTDAAGYDEVLVSMWAQQAGIEVKYVSFSSGAEANAAVLGGHVDVLHEELGPMRSLIRSGDVIPTVIFLEERTDLLPDVPTAKELGWDVTIGRWRGLAVKAGTPEEHMQILHDAFKEAMDSAIYKAMAEENMLNIRPGYLGSEDFKKFIDQELTIYEDVLKSLGYI